MGGQQSKESKAKTIEKQKWHDVRNMEHYTIVRNHQTGLQGQDYEFWLDHRYDPKRELEVYKQRNKINAPIIKTHSYGYQVREKGFADINQFSVITERIPSKLSKLPQLTYPECLYIFDQSLNGFQPLYRKVGPFQVNQQMIGFNKQGQTRVWVNPNYGKNQPSRKRPILLTTKSNPTLGVKVNGSSKNEQHQNSQQEEFMVKSIGSVIENKCEEGRFPESLRNQIYHNCHTFQDARIALRKQIKDKRIIIPNRIDYLNNRVLVSVIQSMGKPIDNSRIQSKQISRNQAGVVQRSENVSVIQQRMPGKSYSQLKFNYQQPKEYFHPQMYVNRN